ncbi:cytidine deaminase [Speluncibacter jeojiensis]|uniref:cytidine deaminase n=1 Tax=Speluncibacter jeojiensis TaxID=2710754 RepID=UPI0024108773|nr:cytidine deaminase [Rhodococcus sp. D2-41]
MVAVSRVDWNVLRSTAIDIRSRAYAPYSGFPVGAAGWAEDGRVVAGCNVENVSLGLTLCAECVLVGNLISAGGGRLVALACVDGQGAALMPCGRCRQVLLEHAAPGMLIDAPDGPVALADLLPHAFGPDQVARGELGGHRA